MSKLSHVEAYQLWKQDYVRSINQPGEFAVDYVYEFRIGTRAKLKIRRFIVRPRE